ncbi:MAG: prepilin peptidase, partial [Victivallales bacterium]|nr:prepilin peptidase [Victivallales bacterium]
MILTLKILFGLLIGSFINVLIVRVPKSESIITPGSHCILCNTPLKWWMNIPLFSFFIFGGKCCYCSGRISWQYPIVELLCAGIWILFFNFNYPFETT